MKYTIVLLLSISATYATMAQSAYRWVDSAGQVHYSSNPPPSASVDSPKKQEVRQETTATLAARAIAEENAGQQEQPKDTKADDTKNSDQKALNDKQTAYNKAAQQKAVQDEAQLKVACEGMRKDLALFTNYPRAKVNVDGVARRLTEEELSTRKKDLQTKINENCQYF